MNIKPSQNSSPKYPALAALAVAASMLSCQQQPPQPQVIAGAPLAPGVKLPPPAVVVPHDPQGKATPGKSDRQLIPGAVSLPRQRLAGKKPSKQLTLGRMKRLDTPSSQGAKPKSPDFPPAQPGKNN